MQVIYQELTKRFEETLLESLIKNEKKEEFENIRKNLINQASKEEFGDYQCNICLVLSKIYKRNPREIAIEFVQKLKENKEISNLCEALEIAGPGFINIKLKNNLLIAKIKSNIKCPRAGVPLSNNNSHSQKKVIVDFSSPNIAKEMHVGHLRSTIIGDSIAKIFELRGYTVLRLNHVGDWGTQFGMLITQLKDLYSSDLREIDKITISDLVEFYKASKKRFDNETEFKKRSREEVVKLQSGDKKSIKAWKLLCNQSRKEFDEIYKILNIKIKERGESFYNPFLKSIIEDLTFKKILVEDQGAKCVFLHGMTNKEGNPLPLIIKKKDGGFNYATTDLAALRYRFRKEPHGDNATRIIYVTDHGQSNHFAGVFQVAKRANWIPEDCEVNHVPFGLVQGIDGKKLKTREGDIIKLKDLLSESIKRAKEDLLKRLEKESRFETEEFILNTSKVIGIGAVKYADLSQNRITNYQFSFEKMLSLNGNTAPYLLYTLVRISGINRKNNMNEDAVNSESIAYSHDLEWKLIRKLLKFDEVIVSIEKDLMPNRLCNYLFELCQSFNRFYDQVSILKVEMNTKISRLTLCALTEKTLKLSLELLGIDSLERM
ncbi:Arginyl-tRNA synthetase [Prochlorococcus marinus str. MIT 9515]|uniref:Arginine--tRNA ligase n=1 Tax=Prochlorococcus marinus (strain MIT 9515) TaxID=167542 RepID=A2BUG4_PROM5|nr:arginine--tRNA ligase [Prochlorococcus marinus]ABM71425.1 Arginyl-tRNA synthetase [Prochlorococcus marinus str. MIT 9515]